MFPVVFSHKKQPKNRTEYFKNSYWLILWVASWRFILVFHMLVHHNCFFCCFLVNFVVCFLVGLLLLFAYVDRLCYNDDDELVIIPKTNICAICCCCARILRKNSNQNIMNEWKCNLLLLLRCDYRWWRSHSCGRCGDRWTRSLTNFADLLNRLLTP